jgi:hypothetical protein
MDFGAIIDLGTYKPTIKQSSQGQPQVSFDSIPNLKEVETDARYRESELYKLIFKNAEGKIKAAIMVRLRTA